MNKYLILAIILAASFGFAQNPWDIPSESSEDLSSPAPAVEATPQPPEPAKVATKATTSSSAPSEKTIFDSLRGHAYNPFGTAGAASSVRDLVKTPSDIHGQKFVYISPDRLGYAAFDFIGGSALLGLDNSRLLNDPINEDLGALVLGYANSVFGVSLNYSISKIWRTNKNNNITNEQRVTYSGDNIELNFSLPLGASTVYVNGGWATTDDSYSNETKGGGQNNSAEFDNSIIALNAGLLGDLGSLSYDVYLSATRVGSFYTNNSGDVAIDPDKTYLGAALGFDIGYKALQSQTARVIVGFNNAIFVAFLDEIENLAKSDNIMGLLIQPNILGEVVLADNWIAFAGASQTIYLIAGDGDRNDQTSQLIISQDSQLLALQEEAVFGGIRYKKANWALEAQVSANPFAAFAGENILTQIGGFIYF